MHILDIHFNLWVLCCCVCFQFNRSHLNRNMGRLKKTQHKTRKSGTTIRHREEEEERNKISKSKTNGGLTKVNRLPTDWTVVYHNGIQLFIIQRGSAHFSMWGEKLDPMPECEVKIDKKTVKAEDVLACCEDRIRMWWVKRHRKREKMWLDKY